VPTGHPGLVPDGRPSPERRHADQKATFELHDWVDGLASIWGVSDDFVRRLFRAVTEAPPRKRCWNLVGVIGVLAAWCCAEPVQEERHTVPVPRSRPEPPAAPECSPGRRRRRGSQTWQVRQIPLWRGILRGRRQRCGQSGPETRTVEIEHGWHRTRSAGVSRRDREDYGCGIVPVVNERGEAIGAMTDRDVCLAAGYAGRAGFDPGRPAT
jgi:hypothetical protein